MEVLDLEHHGHLLGELDDLSRNQTELLVVIKHRVQVLDPQGVHGPIKHDPVCIAQLVGGGLTHSRGEDPVRPVAHPFVVAIQAADRDTLWVDAVDLHFRRPEWLSLFLRGELILSRSLRIERPLSLNPTQCICKGA